MIAEQLELPNIINPRLEDWKLKIGYDNYTTSPREDSNIGEILCMPNRYISNELELPYEYYEKFKGIRIPSEIEDMLSKLGYIHERICIYDHSGVSIYLGNPCCKWDSGIVGWYCVPKSRIREEFGAKRVSKKLEKRVREIMGYEIKTYSNWYNGDVFYYELYKNGELIDSCSGFVADSREDALNDFMAYLPDELTDNFTKEELLSMSEE